MSGEDELLPENGENPEGNDDQQLENQEGIEPEQSEEAEAKAEAEAEAEMEDAFNSVRHPDEQKQEEPEKEPEPPTETEADRKLSELEAKLAQIEEAHQREIRKLHGQYGALKGHVDEMGKGGGELDFSPIAEEYPDFAEKLSEAFKGKGLPGGSSKADIEELKQAIEERDRQMQQALYRKDEEILSAMYTGWREKFQDPAFAQWFEGSVPPEVKQEMEYSPSRFADVLKFYDTELDKLTKATRQREKRLAGAAPIGVRGGGGGPRNPSDEAEFEAGFNSARGRR